jgi:hypothetical protein
MIKKRSLLITSRDFLVIIFCSYAIVISLFVGSDNRNYLVLFAGMLGGVLFCARRIAVQPQALWAFVPFTMMISSAVFNGGMADLMSVAATFIYALGYFAIGSLLENYKDKRTFVQTAMRRLIYAFAVVSLIQMITSLVGLPIPNLIASKGLWSYNSLANEPSQLGRAVGISYLCYLMLDRLPEFPGHVKQSRQARQKVMIAYLTTIILSGSSMSLLTIPLIYVLSKSLVWAFFLTAIIFLIWPLVLLTEYEPLQRVALLLSSLVSLDLDQVLKADHSGGVRIAPFLIYLRDARPADAGFWFGYGVIGVAEFFQYKISGVGDAIGAAFLPGFAVVYGVLPNALFIWVFALQRSNRTTAPLIAFWAILMSSSAWNTQTFWFGLVVIQIAYQASRPISQKARGVSS